MLNNFQRKFLKSVFEHKISPEIFCTNDPNSLQERLKVYFDTHTLGLMKALQRAYPKTHTLLGKKFNTVASTYIQKKPLLSTQPLQSYGEGFSLFMGTLFSKTLANFEWVRHELSHINRDLEVSPSPSKWKLRHDTRLIQSSFNIHELYETLNPDMPAQECFYIVKRENNTIRVSEISPTIFEILNTLKSPHSIEEIISTFSFSEEDWKSLIPQVFTQNYLTTSMEN
jgi:hypothetical protein